MLTWKATSNMTNCINLHDKSISHRFLCRPPQGRYGSLPLLVHALFSRISNVNGTFLSQDECVHLQGRNYFFGRYFNNCDITTEFDWSQIFVGSTLRNELDTTFCKNTYLIVIVFYVIYYGILKFNCIIVDIFDFFQIFFILRYLFWNWYIVIL